MFHNIQRADHTLLWLNGLLLCITFVPFPTALVAEYLGYPGEQAGAAVHAGTFIVLAVLFNLLWRNAAAAPGMLRPGVRPRYIERFSRQCAVGPVLYGMALLLSVVQAWLSLTLCLVLAIFFAVPMPWIENEAQEQTSVEPTDVAQEKRSGPEAPR